MKTYIIKYYRTNGVHGSIRVAANSRKAINKYAIKIVYNNSWCDCAIVIKPLKRDKHGND